MTINVTKEDIDNARAAIKANEEEKNFKKIKGLDQICPVAMSLKRITNRDLSVGQVHIYAEDRSTPIEVLDREVGQKISEFDKEGVMEPFEFETQNI